MTGDEEDVDAAEFATAAGDAEALPLLAETAAMDAMAAAMAAARKDPAVAIAADPAATMAAARMDAAMAAAMDAMETMAAGGVGDAADGGARGPVAADAMAQRLAEPSMAAAKGVRGADKENVQDDERIDTANV